MQLLRLEEVSETDGDQRDLAYRAYWLIFWVIIFLGCGMAAAVASPMSRGCDLENLKRYPMSHALQARSVKITSPNLAAGDNWTTAPDGLLTFFVLPNSVFVDDLIAVLDTEGLAAHAALPS